MGAFNFAFYLFGKYEGRKESSNDGVTVTKQNQNSIKELMEWKNYGGE